MNAEIRRIRNHARRRAVRSGEGACRCPVELLREVHEAGKLPVVNFAAGGVATPADAALMMQLGAEGVFVGQRYLQVGRPGPSAPRPP